MMITDFLFVMLLVVLITYSFGSLSSYYQEAIPGLEEYKSLSFSELKEKTPEIISKIEENKEELAASGVYDNIQMKIIMTLLLSGLLFCLLSSLSRSIVWALVKKSFKKFNRLFIYNFIWIVFWVLVFILLLLIINQETIIQVSLSFIFVYVILALFFRLNYNMKIYSKNSITDEKINKNRLIKLIFSKPAKDIIGSLKFFIYYFISFILILLTFSIVLSISNLFQRIIISNELIIGIIQIIIILALISWARIYLNIRIPSIVGKTQN